MENEHHLHLNGTDTRAIPSWNSSIFGTELLSTDLNCSNECFFTTNWDPPSLDHNDDLFKSALSSIVSSPVASNAGAGSGAGNGFVIRELIGRLGSITKSGEISPQPRSGNNYNNIGSGSNNNSCYNTPLNSPQKLNLAPVMEGSNIHGNLQLPGTYLTSSHPSLAPLNADPGFVERAARFSCFGSGSVGELGVQFWSELGGGSSLAKLEPGKLSRVSSNQAVKVVAGSVNSVGSGGQLGLTENGEVGGSREGSSVSELNTPGGQLGGKVQNDANSRKRKANTKGKGREDKVGTESNDQSPNAKRMKQDEDGKKDNNNNNAETQKTNENGKSTGGGEEGGEKQNGSKESAKPPEPPKDYIHVRARRGQATDSHSLAERVRREKISERMKFLQDLVPGCNKVTGKAVVLDEIINYVQSLQRQVEFLSMKLATVNPQMEYNMEALLSNEVSQSRGLFLPTTMYPLDPTATPQAFPTYSYQQSHQIPPSPNGVYTGSENPSTLMTTPSTNSFHQNSTIQMPSTERYRYSDSPAQVPTFGGDDLHSIIQMGFNNQISEGTKPSTQVKVEI